LFNLFLRSHTLYFYCIVHVVSLVYFQVFTTASEGPYVIVNSTCSSNITAWKDFTNGFTFTSVSVGN